MAEPTLKDVLDALAKIDASHSPRGGAGQPHSERTHRELESRIDRLEKRTAPKKVTARPLRRR